MFGKVLTGTGKIIKIINKIIGRKMKKHPVTMKMNELGLHFSLRINLKIIKSSIKYIVTPMKHLCQKILNLNQAFQTLKICRVKQFG